MTDLLHSMFTTHVPAWVLWLICFTFLMAINQMRRSNAKTVDLAEIKLHQKLRDDVFGTSP